MIVPPVHVKIMPHAMMVIIITHVLAWLIIVELIVREVIKVVIYVVCYRVVGYYFYCIVLKMD